MGFARRMTVGLVVLLVAGCGAVEVRSGLVPGPSPPTTASGGASPTSQQRASLPPGFPVLPGATKAPMPVDDPGLVGLWVTDLAGSAPYDFYVGALPAAGYPIVGAYPGGAAAVIRFTLPDGAVWQVVVRGGPIATTIIEVRLDRS